MQICFTCIAQENTYVKNPAIGIHYASINFNKRNNPGDNSNSEALYPALVVSYLQGISPHIDLSFALAGSYLDYPAKNSVQLGKGNLLMEADASLLAKLFTDNHSFSPYLSTGIGASLYNNYYGIIIPAGAGFQINFFNEVYLLINGQYRFGLTNKVNNHFYYSIGLAGNILKKNRKHHLEKTPLPVASINYDRDKDVIPDSLDACPDVPGLKQFDGCPDTDGDGIPDQEDHCPSLAGTLKYQGCPIPDTDGDGINDEEDSCRTVPGVLKYHGCPIPDSDGDGINDEEDQCPFQAGTIENKGCPLIADTLKEKIALAAKSISFKTGSHELLPQSFQSLNEVIEVLLANPYLRLKIEGHTDNVGTAHENQLLSEARAESVISFLTSRGQVNKNRLLAKGYGFSKPIATNETTLGRSLNRRVELKPFY